MTFDLDGLDFEKGGGVVTVVAVDDTTGRVLMVASADREALEATLATGEMHYRSRSRGLWRKGATSGNVQRVSSLSGDCDGDAVVARVKPAGPACHRGTTSCFPDDAVGALTALDQVVASRKTLPASGYTDRLLADANLRLKKIGEEAAEFVHAAAIGDRARAVEEAADLLYHALVALRAMDAGLDDVAQVLDRRRSSGRLPAAG